MASHNEICFYRANERPYGAFSSLFRRSIVVAGEGFRSVEDAYQSRKPRKPEVRAWLLSAPTPTLVALAAHSLLHWDIAPGWSRLRYPWMLECQRAKFAQHADLREVLLSTGGKRLVEAGTVDNDVNRRWGEVNSVGLNYLGRILMTVRAELGGASYCDPDLAARVQAGAPLLCPPVPSAA